MKNKLDLPLRARDIMSAPHVIALEKVVDEFKNIPIQFPEETFGKLMKQKFDMIGKINEAYLKVTEYGSGKSIVRASMIKIEAIKKFVTELRDFTPEGKDEKYLAAFKKDMVKQTEAILKDANALTIEIRKTIEDKKVLTHDNVWFLSDKEKPIKFEYRYIYSGLTMDRAGKK